ncbi:MULTISPECIES: H-NS histone family protein [unclassified Paracoccus (in: a-proteobacteria)]|uniref:H-NS histone family protein n=1 Tax=unclassified Paracoccus (in: a-proteobacteria) TaxID=2688777 RepID=UPI0012B2FC5C|nr:MULTISPECIES: H-NS histone family protein [unclassified Paracoccus (in: a-proteobacteria)]UXU75774.1 H-NS histone family protein [Paracoccus sp. SMMA_5]UXU81683.1 H-NS histone family protein [Paracoccus sp. SMMA_5_TC]
MTIDLDGMSLRELRELRSKLDRAISTYEERRKREALAAAENAAREYGFSLAELEISRSSRGKVAAKYASPDDPDLTWTGRGRKPKWVQEWLESGKRLEDLAI